MLIVLIVGLAAVSRLWALDVAPPGLYRDEAANGLDALGVLQGNHAIYFTANNGREPVYIYLTALSVALLGRTALAVRLAAAVVGALTTVPVYLLGRAWFGKRVALFSAWLWAVTLWPIHLSRIGLRAVLLPPLLALIFWLVTLAYRRRRRGLWLAAGALYGLSFYTYLAVRFSPLLFLILLSYLLLTRPRWRFKLWPGLLWFALATIIVVLPLGFAALQNPSIAVGRLGQVSIFSRAVSGGRPLLALLAQSGRALGMFLWRGDAILRHNPSGRPVFDLLMILPFLLGLIHCLRHWRRATCAALLMWVLVMLGPTILAEDAPHFLRAVGVLPAALFLPAVGLSKIWEWPKLADALRRGFVLLLCLGTLIVTVSDYVDYVRRPDTAYLFESAARELAQQMNEDAEEATVLADRRFREGWPSVSFLLNDGVDGPRWQWFSPRSALPAAPPYPVSIYAWPYEDLDFVVQALEAPVRVTIDEGPWARGDLEAQAYPLYVRYAARAFALPGSQVLFDDRFSLLEANVVDESPQHLQVDLTWSLLDVGRASPLPKVFVHVRQKDAAADNGGALGQSDRLLGQGYWPAGAWQPGQALFERHFIDLREPYDPTRHQIIVGLYDAQTTVRLPAWTPQGEPLGDSWLLYPEPRAHEEN